MKRFEKILFNLMEDWFPHSKDFQLNQNLINRFRITDRCGFTTRSPSVAEVTSSESGQQQYICWI